MFFFLEYLENCGGKSMDNPIDVPAEPRLFFKTTPGLHHVAGDNIFLRAGWHPKKVDAHHPPWKQYGLLIKLNSLDSWNPKKERVTLIDSLKLAFRTWKMMVGRPSFPFGITYFQGRTVSFRECIQKETSPFRGCSTFFLSFFWAVIKISH